MENVKTDEKMPYIPLKKMRKMVKDMRNMPADTPITFEFFMTAFFPDIFNTIQRYVKDCYTAGYIAGKGEKENES